jgi:uncharacterized protein (DUF1697 family)
MKYVAFLRAINVGGRIVKMDRLKKLFESLKFKNVKTFINSGNVIFETSEMDKNLLTKKIEMKLNNSLGYEVKTMLRTDKEVSEIANKNPFKDEELGTDKRVYIAFLYQKLDKKIKSVIDSLNNKNEKYIPGTSEVYCLINKDEKKGSYFSILLLEKQLGIPLTTRNQNTINKIRTLLDQ